MKDFKEIILDESADENNKILLKSAARTGFKKIKDAIDDFISNSDYSSELKKDRAWKKKKAVEAYRTIVFGLLPKMEDDL